MVWFMTLEADCCQVALGTFPTFAASHRYVCNRKNRFRPPKIGGCAIGIANIDLFAKITGIDFYVEGPLAQFALGRGKEAAAPPGDVKAAHNQA
jgi:hypothetical protein